MNGKIRMNEKEPMDEKVRLKAKIRLDMLGTLEAYQDIAGITQVMVVNYLLFKRMNAYIEDEEKFWDILKKIDPNSAMAGTKGGDVKETIYLDISLVLYRWINQELCIKQKEYDMNLQCNEIIFQLLRVELVKFFDNGKNKVNLRLMDKVEADVSEYYPKKGRRESIWVNYNKSLCKKMNISYSGFVSCVFMDYMLEHPERYEVFKKIFNIKDEEK